MARKAKAAKRQKKDQPLAGGEIWERFLNQIRGVRSTEKLLAQAIQFLMEAFRPAECFVAAPEGREEALRVMSWCSSSLRGAARVPRPEEERRLMQRWGESMRELCREGGISSVEEEGKLNVLSSLGSSEDSMGVLVLAGLASRALGPSGVGVVEGVAEELAERLILLKGVSPPGPSRRREQPDTQAPERALAAERGRVKELESLLAHKTEAEERRARELERMTEQWMYMRNFNESVLQSLSSGLISVDRKGRINYINRGGETILHYGAEEVMGKPLSAAMASKDKRDLLAVGGERDELSMGRQIRVMRKDGVEIPVGFTVSPHLDAKGQEIGRIIHFRDLTKINEMQEELLRMDRLVYLGEISMGIAHEVRNPLTGIRITAQALEEEVRENKGLREYIFRIISEIDRLNDLLKSFFSFAKPQEPQLVPCHIPELINDVLFLLRRDLEQRRIHVEQAHAEDLLSVSVDVNQMKQALLNLFLNSVQAISEEGVIRVATGPVSYRGRRETMISISDTGKGILLEHQPKIFNPFFTTKAKGLGLGLSITYQIVKRHGGHIRVLSEPGKGTTFFVHLPLDNGKAKRGTDETSRSDRR